MRRYPAVIFPFVLVGANLSGQVDHERLRDRDHPVLRRNRMGTANHVNGLEEKERVAINDVVKPTGADGETGDDLAALLGFFASGQDAFLQQRNDRIGDHVGMNAEVTPVLQVLQGLVGNPPQANLQR